MNPKATRRHGHTVRNHFRHRGNDQRTRSFSTLIGWRFGESWRAVAVGWWPSMAVVPDPALEGGVERRPSFAAAVGRGQVLVSGQVFPAKCEPAGLAGPVSVDQAIGPSLGGGSTRRSSIPSFGSPQHQPTRPKRPSIQQPACLDPASQSRGSAGRTCLDRRLSRPGWTKTRRMGQKTIRSGHDSTRSGSSFRSVMWVTS